MMLTGILIISVVGLMAIFSHRRSRLEERVYKNVPLADWLNFSIFPIALYIGWFIVVKNILDRPSINVFPLADFDILAIAFLFIAYGFAGNSTHFTGKILWRYLNREKRSVVFKVNEMFHGKFSHYLVYLNIVFIVFLMAILEINHPLPDFVTNDYLKLIAAGGLVFGYVASKTIFYTNEWFGGYNKPLFFITSAVTLSLLFINHYYRMDYPVYPVNFFIIITYASFLSSFIVRQFIIFSRLSQRKRFRFLAKMFSA